MSDEQEEFAKFTQSLMSAETPAPEAPKEEAATPAPEVKAEETPAEKPAEPPKADTPKVEEKPEDKKVDWRELAAKEKERRAQKAQAKLQQAQREKQFAEAAAKAAQLDEIMKLSKEKRLSALERLGMTLDDVNGEYIRDLEENPNRPPPAVVAAQKELAEIKAELKEWREEKAKREAEAQKAQFQAQRDKIQNEYTAKAAEAIKAKADDYELLGKHPKGSEVVFHFIAAHYASTATLDDDGNVIVPGEELDVHEACKRVEAGLIEQLKPFAESKKLRGASKAQDSTTLAGDVRQPNSPPEKMVDEDKDFLNFGLRLIKQTAV